MGDVDTTTDAVLAHLGTEAGLAKVGQIAAALRRRNDHLAPAFQDSTDMAAADVLNAVPALVAKRDEARAENERLRVVLAANTAYEDTPCRFDHHGYCQEHLRGDIDGRCPVAVARELLAGVEAPAAGTDGGA